MLSMSNKGNNYMHSKWSNLIDCFNKNSNLNEQHWTKPHTWPSSLKKFNHQNNTTNEWCVVSKYYNLNGTITSKTNISTTCFFLSFYFIFSPLVKEYQYCGELLLLLALTTTMTMAIVFLSVMLLWMQKTQMLTITWWIMEYIFVHTTTYFHILLKK